MVNKDAKFSLKFSQRTFLAILFLKQVKLKYVSLVLKLVQDMRFELSFHCRISVEDHCFLIYVKLLLFFLALCIGRKIHRDIFFRGFYCIYRISSKIGRPSKISRFENKPRYFTRRKKNRPTSKISRDAVKSLNSPPF